MPRVPALQPRQRLVEAAALQIMREHRIHRLGQLTLQREDRLGYLPEARELPCAVAVAPGRVANDGQAFAQCAGEFVVDRGWIHDGKIACSWAALQPRSA